MRILILGGSGMLGHQLWRSYHGSHEVWVSLRGSVTDYLSLGLFDSNRAICGVEATNSDHLVSVFRQVRPEAVINCVGIIKQKEEADDPATCLSINALLPHRLSALCSLAGARLVHISTDCVFSGRRGNYTEKDVSDAEDLYGRSKFLGEVHAPHCITLRTSIIGREISTSLGLIEWFLSKEGTTVKGFRRAIYTGLTTQYMARVIEDVLVNWPEMNGVWHVSSDPINKYELLGLAKSAFGWHGEILPDDDVVCDRSLNSTRFRQHTCFVPPSWEAMISELAEKAG